MPTLNTDCWNEIKGFLLFEKDERRETLHGAAMKEMLTTVAADMMPGGEVDANLRRGLRVYDAFINQPNHGDMYEEFFEMSEWFDGLNLFNGRTSLFENVNARQMFYMEYIFKALKVKVDEIDAETVTTDEAGTMTEAVAVIEPGIQIPLGVTIAAGAVAAIVGSVAGAAIAFEAWEYIAPVD